MVAVAEFGGDASGPELSKDGDALGTERCVIERGN